MNFDAQYEHRRRMRVREHFDAMAKPYYRQIDEIRQLHTQYRMMVYPDGRVSDLTTVYLPEWAERYIAQCEEMIRMCADIAERENPEPPRHPSMAGGG